MKKILVKKIFIFIPYNQIISHIYKYKYSKFRYIFFIDVASGVLMVSSTIILRRATRHAQNKFVEFRRPSTLDN